MDKYKCQVCGKTHHVYRGIEDPLPDMIFEIPEEERKNRIISFDEFHLVDNKHLFGKGYILLEMENLDEPIYSWLVWAKIDINSYKNSSNKLSEGKIMELDGELLSPLPYYKKAKGLKSKILAWYENEEIHIRIHIKEDSQLMLDQLNPITKQRAIEINQHIHHPELFREIKSSKEPFTKRLHQELEKAENQFLNKNKNFAINISSYSTTLFQLISSNMLEVNHKNRIGFGLHFSFDDSFEETKQELQNFKNQDYFKEFTYHLLDKIPTYQLYLRMDKTEIEKLVQNLVESVYDQEIESINLDGFEI